MGRKIMTVQELDKAKDRDLAASLTAMQRAARMARELAVRTNTAIIVTKNRQLVRITAEELRKEGIR
jgi:hypothetical protein